MLFSPQAWGCTAQQRRRNIRARVFPTGVGVYRSNQTPRRYSRSFPHRRGGVPATATEWIDLLAFSPQAWGCTVHPELAIQFAHVFPTGVGVYR